jgi:hypothetical protein
MIRLVATIARLRLTQDSRGLALIEFALILPFVMVLGFGGVEIGNYVSTYMRVSEIAMTAADNAGRVRHGLEEDDVNSLMVGAKLMGGNINFATQGRLILTDLEQRTETGGPYGATGTKTADNPNGYRQWIRWQRCMGALNKSSSWSGPLDKSGNPVTNLSANVTNADGTINYDHGAMPTYANLDGMGPAPQIASTSGTAVMVVEVYYQYIPLVAPMNLIPNLTIHTTEAFNIRQRTDYHVYNDGGLSGTQRSDCSMYNAAIPSS